MGYLLYREVKRYAPADLDTGELALLLILADEADETTRECWPGIDELARYMRMSTDGVGRILKRLADKDIEVRVVLGKDKHGRKVYAHKGVRTTYLLPRFALLAPDDDVDSKPGPASDHNAKARTSVRPSEGQSPDHSPTNSTQSPDHSPTNSTQSPDAGPANETQRSDCGPSKVGPASDPSPHIPQEEDPHLLLSKPQQILRDARLGLTPEEEKKIIKWANRKDRKGVPWWRTLAANGDLADLVAEWRETATAAATEVTTPQTGPPPWCGTCGPLVEGNSVARVNIRFRTLNGKPGGTPCPQCHPEAQKGTP